MTDHITPGQLAKVLEVTPRVISHHVEQFIGEASIKPANGRGSRRILSYVDALLVYVGSKLNTIGVSHRRINEICRWLKDNLEAPSAITFFPKQNSGIGIFIPINSLRQEFNRKLNKVRK